MLKQANLSFSVTAQANGNETNAIQFSTQDKKTAKLIFTIKEGKKPLNLTDIDGEITLVMQDKSRFVSKAEVTKPLDGVLEYTLTQEQIRHAGRAQGEIILKAVDGSSVGGFRFNFTIKKALVDEDLGPVKEFYIQDLETVRQDVKKKADAAASDINNLKDELETIAGNLEEEYQNKAYTVDEKLADVQATVNDLRENGTGIDAQARQEVEQVSAQVADIAINLKNLDIFTDGNLDGQKISKIFNENNRKTFFLPNGQYTLVNPIRINNEISFMLGQDAIIKPLTIMDSMLIYDCNYSPSKRRFISGGVFNGDGKASKCINVASCGNLTLERMLIMNPVNKGVLVSSGYEFMCQNLLLRNTIDTNINDNIAISINTSDSVLNDVVIINYTIGVEVTQSANIFNNFHIWGSQSSRLPLTIGLVNKGVGNYFEKFYFDTCAIGAQTTTRTNLKDCLFNVARSYRSTFTTPPIFIQNTGTGTVLVDNSYFEYSNNTGETYKCIVVDGNKQYVQFVNCDFATPANLEAIPASNKTPKIYRIRVSFTNWPGIAAGSYYDKEVTVSQPDFSIDYRDTIIYNSGKQPVGIIPSYYALDNKIGLRLQNISSNQITPANTSVFVTVIKNADGNIFPYTDQT